ncbi:hypothetical protein jhhlp_005454 [Lomentospora prolificans]|uniref:Uncharacterized protein n=1 Tax=Lomentospora prolificans TaxID=41688 RepID=A0A2N3N6X1_9PEZI|nr:hypothetical protein jhhlp_005454 [Lomentospora prolificans]
MQLGNRFSVFYIVDSLVHLIRAMAFTYRRILIVGATAGIGAALADKFISEGSKVIAVGRRQERLDAFVQKHGSDKTGAIRYDVTDSAGLDAFVQEVVTQYPDLDCVLLNAGVQSAIRLSRPAEVDLAAFHNEVSTNFSRLVDLSIKFLPHLLEKPFQTALAFTGSNIALVPAVLVPAYSASKAALNAYVYCLRRQNQGKSTKIIEIWPPAVQTEIHDYMGEDVGRALGMPIGEFIEQAWSQLAEGSEHVMVGGIPAEEPFKELANKRREAFELLSGVMLAKYQL